MELERCVLDVLPSLQMQADVVDFNAKEQQLYRERTNIKLAI